MKKKNSENYLERKPQRNGSFSWEQDDKGMVTLIVENRGLMNRIFQVLLKKPKTSFIHLDEMGSFVWPLLDGEKTILELGEEVKKHFGEKAEPLYERLSRYMHILESYGFIRFSESKE